MNEQPTEQNATVVYPTAQDAEGFYFESADDQDAGISTKVYENGSRVKQCKLPVSGKMAVIRELRAKDTKEISRFMNKDAEKYQMAAITVALTLDGSKVPYELVESMLLKDYNRVMSMYSDLNF